MSDQDAEMNSQPAETTMIDTTGKKEKPLVPVNEFLKRRKKKDSPAKEEASDEGKPAQAAAAQDEAEDADMAEGEAEVEDAPFGAKKSSSRKQAIDEGSDFDAEAAEALESADVPAEDEDENHDSQASNPVRKNRRL